jgi:hypothetical protein
MTGKRIYFVGHSFHMFIVRPLIYLAREAGIKGHWAEGWDMIGGSTPTQHWERAASDEGADENEVKQALRTGRVEVLTLASNVIVPEPAIDLFADLAVECNPEARVMVQHSWGDKATTQIMRARHGGTTIDLSTVPSNEDRDATTAEELEAYRASTLPQRAALRAQLKAIDERHGRAVTSMVPVSEAVIRLRELVVDGGLPGVTRQSELFRDALGHATQPTMDVVTYTWFAALYGINPKGSTCLIEPDDPTAHARHDALTDIAWRSLLDEPKSGLAVIR